VNNDTLPAGLKARILEAAEKQISPVRKSVTFETALVLLTAAAATANVFLAVGGADFGSRSTALVVSSGLGRASIALASTWAAFARGGSMLGRSLAWLATTIVTTPLAIALWMVLARPADIVDVPSPWHCVGTALFFGLVPLGAFTFVHRQSDVARPVATGAALGAAAGAWADVLLVLHCPGADLAHRLLCHVGPTALLVALGALLGGVVIRPGARTQDFGTERTVAQRFTNGG